MYSVVMVVAMAGAPEAPTCCCWKDVGYKSCCNTGCGNKSCCDKNYAPAAPVAVAPAPAPVKVAPAPVAVAPAQDCGKGYGSKGCCLDCLCCWKKCCDKGGYSNKGCDQGYSNKGCCDKGGYSKGGCDQGYSNKGCCFCCDKGGYTAAPVVVPVETPKKDMPKVKVGG